MTINQKINFRGNALFLLTWSQYCQLVDHNRMVLAPYYQARLLDQAKYLKSAYSYPNGRNRWEYENGLRG